MGIEPMLGRCAVRVSLGKDNTPVQVENFLKALSSVVNELRRMNTVASIRAMSSAR